MKRVEIKNILIDFEKEKLIINGNEINDPVIVTVPYEAGYIRSKIFNYKKGCCRRQLPKVSVSIENLGS